MIQVIFRFQNGEERAAKPSSLFLRRDADTPADSLELSFLAAKPLFSAEPEGVQVLREGVLLFSGIVDEHNILLDENGRRETFSCRSLAARMIDSEALPGLLRMPSLRLMEQRFLQPLGLAAGQGDRKPKAGELTVEKGTSVWSAVSAFAREMLQTEPWCGRDGAVHFCPREAKWLTAEGILSAEICRRPYSVVSRVVVQNSRSGAYSTVYENPEAAGVYRVRYLSARAKTAPKALIAAGERGRLSARLTLAGYADGDPGDLCDASAADASLGQMQVESLRYSVSETGERTVLELGKRAEE